MKHKEEEKPAISAKTIVLAFFLLITVVMAFAVKYMDSTTLFIMFVVYAMACIALHITLKSECDED